MKIKYEDKKLNEIEADIELIVVVNKDLNHNFVKSSKDILDELNYKGDQDETILLPEQKKLFVGAKSLKNLDIRSAIASAIRAVKGKNYKSIKMATYLNYDGCSFTIKAIAESALLGAYSFDRYKSKATKSKLKTLIISSESYNSNSVDKDAAKKIIKKAKIIADSVNLARDIVNTPPDDFYPKVMAGVAKDIAKTNDLECKILTKQEIKAQNMNALLAVSRASVHAPRVICLSYKPKNPKAVISLVGKGLTYDSGGLSLKPSDFMATMKLDKSGGTAVLAILKAVSELKLPIEVHGFIGAVENMIGGNAYKPDDVITTKSGKTVEVKNTDAEGRLVLADVLTFAQQEVKADYIIDLATLTGACVVALGNYTIGIMGNNEELLDSTVKNINISSGELSAKLPFNPLLPKTLKSDIADISNISNTRYGGAITAGLFLDNFIEEENKDKWMHFDIAGPAFVSHNWLDNPVGGSGAGVRAVIKFIEKLVSEHPVSD